ncbi:MAG: SPFH domain-containing protein, partial [Caldilineaceae bacterium]
FLTTLILLIVLTLVVQLISKMKLVPPSQLAVVHGKGQTFRMFRGGRVFVLPLINRFNTMDLTPQTTTVAVESAIAKGIVPLTVTATVSFAVAKSELGMVNAVKRILHLTDSWEDLQGIATSIIEGHLRDSIASMTPEEVMSHKERLIQNMIMVCKSDLEGIGLEITTMNIADVDDHRLDGVEEPDLYIALLKRIQTANAQSQSREAQAEARAASQEEQETRRAEVTIQELRNEYARLDADTKVKVAREKQRGVVGQQEATRNAESEVAGVRAQIEAEKQRIEMVKARLEASLIVPAGATKQKLVENAMAEVAGIRGQAQAELEQLGHTIEILQSGGEQGATAYLIEKFGEIVSQFASSMELFPVDQVTVISGRPKQDGPISAIHPSAIDADMNRRLAAVLGGVASAKEIDAACP